MKNAEEQFEILEHYFSAKHDRGILESLHLMLENDKKLKKLGKGSTRTVYKLNNRFVLKVPNANCIYGGPQRASLSEILLSRRFHDTRIFATTKPFIYAGQIILLAERTKQLFDRQQASFVTRERHLNDPKKPKIFNKLYDGSDQLGKDRNGNIISFDFGLERHMLELLPMGTPRDFTKAETDRIKNRLPHLETLLSRI